MQRLADVEHAVTRTAVRDDRKRVDKTEYVSDGGGGGKHAVLDETKMVGSKPSPRPGRMRRLGDPV